MYMPQGLQYARLVEKRLGIDGLSVVGKTEEDAACAVRRGDVLVLLHLFTWGYLDACDGAVDAGPAAAVVNDQLPLHAVGVHRGNFARQHGAHRITGHPNLQTGVEAPIAVD